MNSHWLLLVLRLYNNCTFSSRYLTSHEQSTLKTSTEIKVSDLNSSWSGLYPIYSLIMLYIRHAVHIVWLQWGLMYQGGTASTAANNISYLIMVDQTNTNIMQHIVSCVLLHLLLFNLILFCCNSNNLGTTLANRFTTSYSCIFIWPYCQFISNDTSSYYLISLWSSIY